MRVDWPSTSELSADDILDHFGAYGDVSDLEWLDDSGNSGKEVMKLYFELPSSITAVLRECRHRVKRDADGKLIDVKAYVKFSDNAVSEHARK